MLFDSLYFHKPISPTVAAILAIEAMHDLLPRSPWESALLAPFVRLIDKRGTM